MTKTFKFLCTITLFFIFGYSCQKAKTQSDRSLLASYTEEEHVDEWFLRTEDKASNLYIKEIGSGEPVLVLHGGFGNDHTNVVKVSNGLTDTFRFVFYDQRGSSLSYCEREAITVDNHVQDIETIRKALGIEKLTLVTHSASTILGFLYLEKFPDNVKRIVFLGAMHPKNGNGNKEIFTDEEWNTFEVSDKEKQQFNSRPEGIT